MRMQSHTVHRACSQAASPPRRRSIPGHRGWRTAGAVAGLLTLVAVQLPSTPQAAFPGANGKIAFSSGRNGIPQIFVMDADGSNQTAVTTERGYDPRWSPDGTKIAFASDRSGFSAVFVINAGGSGETQLTGLPGRQDSGPSWSPDGTRIAFYSTRSGVGEVWVMDADGSNPVNLTGGVSGGQPAWSPDGSRIAFSSTRDGNSEIYVMDADGSNPANLTTDGAVDVEPSWSPDGTKLAFASNRHGGDQDVYVMNADGTNVIRLTTDAAEDQWPRWSPDGTKLTFRSDRDGDLDIYVTGSAAGASVTRLTTAAGSDFDPDWQRVGNQPPIAVVGPDQPAVACSSAFGCTVTLDGTGSSDPDGDSLTYTWVDSNGSPLGGAVVNPILSLGTHVFTLTVDDGNGGTASDTVSITLVDPAASGSGTGGLAPLSGGLAPLSGGGGTETSTSGLSDPGDPWATTFAVDSIVGTPNQVIVTGTDPNFTLSAPQDLHTGALFQVAGRGLGRRRAAASSS